MGVLRSPLPLVLLLVAVPPLDASQPTPVARLQGFEIGQVRQARFELVRPVQARVSGIGSGGVGSLYAYAWLLELGERRVVWSMVDAEPREEVPGTRSLRFEDQVRLPPGRYALCYFAGKHYKAPGGIALHGILERRTEQPRQWFASVALLDDSGALAPRQPPDFPAAPAAPLLPEAPALPGMPVAPPGASSPGPIDAAAGVIRLAPLGDSAFHRLRFHVAQPVEARLYAVGEVNPRSKEPADHGWLLELESRRVVWAMDGSQAEHAGGASKNRLVRQALRLEAGDYELVAATDDSHSPDEWNAFPPYAPFDWGVTLEAAPGSFDPGPVPEERVIARLAGAGDDETLSALIRLDQPTRVRVYCSGEWSGGQGQLADWGAIERANGEVVWKMEYRDSFPGGGAAKNRLVDTSIELPAGTYRLRFRTDDSHSAVDWNDSPPHDARNWGISLSTFDLRARFELLELDVAGPRG